MPAENARFDSHFREIASQHQAMSLRSTLALMFPRRVYQISTNS
jgi:hypothetical protein